MSPTIGMCGATGRVGLPPQPGQGEAGADVNNVPEFAWISARIATAPTRQKRFLAVLGLASDLSIDSSPNGIAEAIDRAEKCLNRQNAGGEAWDLDNLDTDDFASVSLEPLLPMLHLLLETALIEEEQVRADSWDRLLTLVTAQREDAIALARRFVAATQWNPH